MAGDGLDLLDEAKSLLPRAVEMRRRIHMHPELGNDLPETKATVMEAIGDLDLDLAFSEQTSGIVATLEGARPGPTILLRGDMDALPMTEDTGLDFASKVDGRMHACGHDAHTAMLATAARLLSGHRERLAGRVKFMFQPGEEGPGGAKPMIDEGVLDHGGAPDAAFALHVFPNFKSGVVACRPGPVLAAADQVKIRILGRGGHGSMPYTANDPVPVACELVQAMLTFITRRIKTFDPAVLSVGLIRAGTVNNVIPAHAEMECTLRSFSDETRDLAHAGLTRLAENIAAAHEMSAEITIDEGYPVTTNDGPFSDFVAKTARGLLGDKGYVEMSEPVMGSEDFSYVLQRTEGAFAFLGAAPDGVDPVTAPTCHSNFMMIDEEAMAAGIAMHAAVACRYLGAQN